MASLGAMFFDPALHHRRSMRKEGFDYRTPGPYFVTACTKRRVCLFGRVRDGEMRRNAAGEVIRRTWKGLPGRFPTVDLDSFIVMPNHVHGILVLGTERPGEEFSPVGLSTVVQAFKSIAAVEVNRDRVEQGMPPVVPLWQRGFHDHIIRTGDTWEEIAWYIECNPAYWEKDPLNHPPLDP